MGKNVLLFTSKDSDTLHDEAIRIISSEFKIQKVFRTNRDSPNLDSIRFEIEAQSEIQYIFNFLSPKIFPKWLLNLPNIACINIHPGSFEYPGVGSASFSLYDQKSEYGVTAHYMQKSIDSGGIIAERFFDQKPYHDCQSLFERALEECPKLLEDVVGLLKLNPKPKIVNNWAKAAVTREEFESWMILDQLQSNLDWDGKIKALVHPKFSGPRIKIGEHTFVYEHSNN